MAVLPLSDLHAWFLAHQRDLPWRRRRDAYAVWLSEIMLQQTRVDTVVPYFERFVARFPGFEALALADEQEVLKLWEGLGYYARARNLLAAARRIAARHNGRFPDSLDAAEALPGIARSTAGAILSAAYDRPLPVLDGNVKRVLARIMAIREDLTRPAAVRKLWETAGDLVLAAPDPDRHNQAMMELGATCCTPRAPDCATCPVATACKALDLGIQAGIPAPKKTRTIPHHHVAVAVIVEDGRTLIQQRPSEGLLGGLWEFPGGKVEPGETPAQAVVRELAEELALAVEAGDELATVKHAYSHFRITLHAFSCRRIRQPPVDSGPAASRTPDAAAVSPPPCDPSLPPAARTARWVPLEHLDDYPFPKANKKVLDRLLGR
ncbi:MAG: A/G-specific adenine glycosylase [Deltaproteobacteria bacterium]|nr:A/G-specific adenine glycosylase [Deltaproteobacteria bacterium]